MSILALKNLIWRGLVGGSLSYRKTDPEGAQSPALAPLLKKNDELSNSAGVVDLESQEPTKTSRGFQVNARVISDATIGLSDGLTVPFALTAGLSALGNTRVVIFGGLAELIAGAISMGLGGYLGAKSEIASYNETLAQTAAMAESDTTATESAIRSVLAPYGLPATTLDAAAAHLASSPQRVDFLMRFQHCAEEPAASRALTSAATIALAYFLGGLVPLAPYFFFAEMATALAASVAVMAVALFAFGIAKTGLVVGWTGPTALRRCLYGGIQMVVVGGLAAGAAMALVKASDHLAGE